MASHFNYLLVGGGIAAASAVQGIRELDQHGSIGLMGKEAALPYDRPPLTKGLWNGKTSLAEIPVKPQQYYTDNDVTLNLGVEAVHINAGTMSVTNSRGEVFEGDKILLATGGRPRTLPVGKDILQYYRTVVDYRTVRAVTDEKQRFTIVGGGFIGAELAAAICSLGKRVTMVFPDNYLLQKVLPRDLAAFITSYYREHGINILPGDTLAGAGRSGAGVMIATKNGAHHESDLAIGAIGIELNTAFALDAGFVTSRGIETDEYLRTHSPAIYAAGDVALFPSMALEKLVRVEHWDNARAQGLQAGRNMAGADEPYRYLPYFWSDLFDIGFEAIGEVDSRLEVLADWKTPMKEGVLYYHSGNRVRGVLLWNVWEKVDAARELVNSKEIFGDIAQVRGRL